MAGSIYSGTSNIFKYFNGDGKKLYNYIYNITDEEWLKKVNSPILKISLKKTPFNN